VGGDREGADGTAQRVQVRLRGDETVLRGGRLRLRRGQGDARGVVALGRGLGLCVEDVELVLRGGDLRGDRVGRRRSRRQADDRRRHGHAGNGGTGEESGEAGGVGQRQ